MLDGLRVLRHSWRLFYEDMFYLAAANLLWGVLAFFIIPIPATTAIIYCVANRVARGEAVKWEQIWATVRSLLGRIYLFGIINGLIYFILLYNAWFYTEAPGDWGAIVWATPVALLALWTLIQLNWLPVLLESEEKRFWAALRDAALLVFYHPGFYLTIYFFLLILMLVSTYLIFPWVIITLGYISLVLNVALLDSRGFYADMIRRQAELERKRRLHGDTER